MIRWAVFVSGEGTNLQNFLDLEPKLKNQKIVLVHSHRECPGLDRARLAEKVVSLVGSKSNAYDDQVLSHLRENNVNSIFLMGYMRILSPYFLKMWKSPLVNLHPSLLPDFKGKDAVRQAYDAGRDLVGVSLHEVVEEVDSGRILKQLSLKRDPSESFDSLIERIHALERKCVSDYLFDLDASLMDR